MNPPNVASRELIESRVIPEPNTGCWLWCGAHGTSKSGLGGYGLVKISGRTERAHRVSYAVFVSEVPPGLSVLHRCDTPACVNPAHLFLGTNQDNSKDKHAKGRGNCPRGSAHGRSKLTAELVSALRQNPPENISAFARSISVAPVTLQHALAGRSWLYVEPAAALNATSRTTVSAKASRRRAVSKAFRVSEVAS